MNETELLTKTIAALEARIEALEKAQEQARANEVIRHNLEVDRRLAEARLGSGPNGVLEFLMNGCR